jgi:hypothetical protein
MKYDWLIFNPKVLKAGAWQMLKNNAEFARENKTNAYQI